MNLMLADRVYPINESLQRSTLADLYELKVATGIGMKTLKASLDAMADLDDPEDFLESEAIMLALNALVWLCRRRAGEKLTIAQACDVALADIRLVPDENDIESAEADADPT